MSFTLVGLVASRKCGGAVRKCILYTLASIADDEGESIWASVPTIGRKAEVSPRAAFMHMKALRDDGLLRVVGERECLNGKTVVYALNIEKIAALPPLKRPPKASKKKGETPAFNAGVQEIHPCTGFMPTPASNAGVPLHDMQSIISLEPIQGIHPCPSPEKSGDDSENQELPVFSRSGKNRKARRKPKSALDCFDELWALWPAIGRGRTSKAKVLAALSKCAHEPSIILAAARAYLASKDLTRADSAGAKGLHSWLLDRLDSWVELASSEAPVQRPIELPVGPAWWRAAAQEISSRWPDDWRFVWSHCDVAPGNRPALIARTGWIADKLSTGLAGAAHTAFGFDAPIREQREGEHGARAVWEAPGPVIEENEARAPVPLPRLSAPTPRRAPLHRIDEEERGLSIAERIARRKARESQVERAR